MILRVFWPSFAHAQHPFLSDHDLAKNSPSCFLLLGAVLQSTQQSQQVLTVAVVSLCPCSSSLQTAAQTTQQQLTHHKVSGTDAATAQLAVLGVWQPCQQQQSVVDAPPDQPCGLWLVLRSAQGLSGRHSPTSAQAPVCDLQLSALPPGTQSVQVFEYAVPAQQPGFARVRLPQPPPALQLPWAKQPPGAVSLSAVMQMLQDAHAALQVHLNQQGQHQPERLEQQAPQQQQQQRITRQRRRMGQQEQQQQQQGWSQLAAIVMAAAPRPPQSWLSQQRAWLAAAVSTAVQRLAPKHHAFAAATQQQQQQHMRGAPASSDNISSMSDSEPVVMQFVVQHLLGFLVGLNLLLHKQLVLEAAAGVASWLQHDILHPHVQWLQDAQPGGIKLHLELSLVLGTAASACLHATAALYSLSWPWLGPAALATQAAAAAVGGASWACAAAADVLLVLLWPLVVLYVVCAQLHRLHLRCLAASWRLIRGKQKVRRFSTHHRTQQQQQQPPHSSAASPPGNQQSATATAAAAAAAAAAPSTPVGDAPEPSDEVSVEQLIVGVLLFTPLLGLLPTTTAWYLSVTCLYGGLHCLRLLLVVAGSWMQLRPLHVLAARWSRPQMFPGQLMVLPLSGVNSPGVSSSSSSTSSRVRAGRDGAAVAGGGADRLLGGIDVSTRKKGSSSAGGSNGGVQTRARSRAGSSSQVAAHAGGGDSTKTESARVVGTCSYYSIFYEPLGYCDVLVHSILQQQGLLWYVCQGGTASSDGGGAGATAQGGSWLVRCVKDVAAGRTWGLRLLSTQWRLL